MKAIHRPAPHRTTAAAAAALLAAATVLTACGSDGGSGRTLALTAALPQRTPQGTEIRIGDPAIQVALKSSGLDKQLAAEGVDVSWADLSGGPQTIQAFRADQLDCGAVADIPSLFAAWTGTSTKIVFNAVTVDPLHHPVYQLGVAPGSDITSLADLKGKKIAYSPGQAQGALVLRVLQKAGLTQKDVKLVEMTSTTAGEFATALGSKAVDVAPLGISQVKAYEAKYPGATTIDTGIRDDASTLYCLTKAVQDPDKAAALTDYVAIRTKALLWENAHPDQFAQAYYVQNQGLSAADAAATVKAVGDAGIPQTWDNAVQRLQETADLLAKEQDHKHLDVATLVDRRFEKVEAEAAGSDVVTGDAS
ncbi:ABC transporter substrate-binding protein [Nocardioides sp. BP30]|uniref:ABC transporter substrate-binding protein n=1 Tax=Nocardioides sp. BP30 TaxID=3036374 RepID=UPI002469B0EC|nr:ABC transporter substrate-binding protein [Nocardioides sp. BP30]WGL52397.1 ABC transporter substrate-binding protein [Nocardioides sp. BP30]